MNPTGKEKNQQMLFGKGSTWWFENVDACLGWAGRAWELLKHLQI